MHFVHIPWPQPDYWRILPKDMRCAIHDGLIANDVVGFHTDRWRRNFIYSVRELLGEDVTAKTVTAPISVDRRRVRRAGAERRRAERRARDSSRAAPRSSSCASTARIRRRTSCAASAPSSSISTRIRSCTGGSGMLALLDPSRQDIPEYAEYLGAIQREARRVNDRFQQSGWRPIDLRDRGQLRRTRSRRTSSSTCCS